MWKMKVGWFSGQGEGAKKGWQRKDMQEWILDEWDIIITEKEKKWDQENATKDIGYRKN